MNSTIQVQEAAELTTSSERSSPTTPAGIVIGKLISIDSDGRVWLRLPGAESKAILAASCLCDPSGLVANQRLAVMFVEGRADLPVVVGPILAEVDVETANAIPETIELTASKHIVLKCGRAVLRLLGDGSAVIRGDQVVSRATRTNRIRGGNVQIN